MINRRRVILAALPQLFWLVAGAILFRICFPVGVNRYELRERGRYLLRFDKATGVTEKWNSENGYWEPLRN